MSHRSDLAAELAACREELAVLSGKVDALTEFASGAHQAVMLGLRYVRDDDERARKALWALRETPEYARPFEEDEPLVTIIVPTYRNVEQLTDRALPSVLGQTHSRLEVIVVGDGAPAEVETAVRSFDDPRLRFVNLPYRGPYPADPARAWFIAGAPPSTAGSSLARGSWVAFFGDDDAMRPTCVERLLAHAREHRAEAPYGQIEQKEPDGGTTLLGTFPPESGRWGTQSTLFHAGLRFIRPHVTDWPFETPWDWSLADRMLRIGVRFAMIDETVVDYNPSSLWTDRLTRDFF